MDFWDANFFKNRIFHFGQFLMHQKKFQGILKLLNMVFLDTFLSVLSEYV